MLARLSILYMMALSAPVHAAGGIQIPEPSNMALMGLGLTGLIIGRYAARTKAKREDPAPKD